MKKTCCGTVGWVVLNAALWFGGGAATVHLATRSPESEFASAQHERIERAFEELDLSEEQDRAVQALLEKFRGDMVEAREDYFGAMQDIELRTEVELSELLTEEQRSRVPGLGS